MLLTLLLLLVHTLPLQAGKVWRCTGSQSKYSYLDCERDYSYSDGCYYVEHFSQFRPCAWICNDIEFSSIDEERCRAFCSGYLNSYCTLKETMISTIPTTTTRNTEQSPTTTVTETNRPPISAPYLLLSVVAPVFGLTIIALLVTFVVLCVEGKKRQQKNNGGYGVQVWQPSLNAEESKIMVWGESEIPSECSETEKMPTAENGFNDDLEKIAGGFKVKQ